MANINVDMLKERLYVVSKALFCIGEVCVDVSKQHITEEYALNKIRVYLNDAHMWSRFQVDQLIEDCMEPIVTNIPYEIKNDWLKDILSNPPAFEPLKINYPDCCEGCSNNPKNGGSGICNCTLPYMQNLTTYTVPYEDACMANNIDSRVYFVADTKSLTEHKASPERIAEAVERTKKYIKDV